MTLDSFASTPQPPPTGRVKASMIPGVQSLIHAIDEFSSMNEDEFFGALFVLSLCGQGCEDEDRRMPENVAQKVYEKASVLHNEFLQWWLITKGIAKIGVSIDDELTFAAADDMADKLKKLKSRPEKWKPLSERIADAIFFETPGQPASLEEYDKDGGLVKETTREEFIEKVRQVIEGRVLELVWPKEPPIPGEPNCGICSHPESQCRCVEYGYR